MRKFFPAYTENVMRCAEMHHDALALGLLRWASAAGKGASGDLHGQSSLASGVARLIPDLGGIEA